MSEPYAYADKQLKKLSSLMNAAFINAGNAISFDELNVLTAKRSAKELYERIEREVAIMFRWIALKAYETASEETDDESVDLEPKVVEERGNDLVDQLLAMYHPVTEFVYTREVLRKRDRLFEAMVSAEDHDELREAYAKAARLLFKQIRQYADFTVDEARIRAFKDIGVTHVKWVAQNDGKVCETCLERDGQIYAVDEVPRKPHWYCRCVLKPVRNKD